MGRSSQPRKFDLRIVWESVVSNHLLIQDSRVVGASATLDWAFAGGTLGTTTGDLETAVRRYGYIPTASVAVGYRF